jgi:hypothetical protein
MNFFCYPRFNFPKFLVLVPNQKLVFFILTRALITWRKKCIENESCQRGMNLCNVLKRASKTFREKYRNTGAKAEQGKSREIITIL